MPKKPEENVKARLANAQADADRAARAVQARSETRLAELMRMAPAKRLKALEDPDLVQADRAKLRHSIEGSLKSASPRLPWPCRPALHRIGPALLRALLSVPGIVAIVVGLPWLAVAWINTHPGAVLTQKGLVVMVLPNGTQQYVSLQAGSVVRVYGRSGDETAIGLWWPQLGWGRAVVPGTALRPAR